MTQAFEKRNSSGDKNSILKGNFAKGISSSPNSAIEANVRPNGDKKHMTEREKL